MTSFRWVFVLLVVTFTTDTTPSLVFKSFDDLFTGHELFIHTNTHHVKVKEKWDNSPPRICQKEERAAALYGATLNQFIVQSSLDRAGEILEREETFTMCVFGDVLKNLTKQLF